jgi:quercetin dioxygenase-like cupin family protein
MNAPSKALGLLLLATTVRAADPILLPSEITGAATVIHRVDALRGRATNSTNSATSRGGLWPLYSSAEARLNYFEVAARTPMHFHPDADHRLYVLEGTLVVTCGTNTTTNTVGDFIVIPRGVRHSYDVPNKGGHALLLTFDAPPYDSKRTVNIPVSP